MKVRAISAWYLPMSIALVASTVFLRKSTFKRHRSLRDRRVRLAFAISFLMVGSVCSAYSQTQKDNPDYSLGKPRLWSYKRVYPFLDGIFQDVASTQVSSLTLNANGINASTLDATLNSTQVGLSYNPVAAAQNALLQQQNGVVSANAALQSQLLTQQAALTQQLVTGSISKLGRPPWPSRRRKVRPIQTRPRWRRPLKLSQLQTQILRLLTVNWQSSKRRFLLPCIRARPMHHRQQPRHRAAPSQRS